MVSDFSFYIANNDIDERYSVYAESLIAIALMTFYFGDFNLSIDHSAQETSKRMSEKSFKEFNEYCMRVTAGRMNLFWEFRGLW